MDKQYLNLPTSVNVQITKGKSGHYIAEIPEYDIFTEAEYEWELDGLINDLLFVFFDVPHNLRHTIRYVKEEPAAKIDLGSHLVFQKFISSEVQRLYR